MAGRQCRSSGITASGGTCQPVHAAELVGCFGGEVPVEAQHVGGVVGGQKTGPAITVGPMVCSANRNEVTPKLPPPPRSAKQIGVFVGGRPDDAAVGGDHLGGQQLVDGEPVFAHEEADATAEGEPGDAGVAHDAAGGGQTVGLRLVVDVAPQSTTLHPGRAVAGSTHTGRIAERSMTTPPSHTAVPATLWPRPVRRSPGRGRGRSARSQPRRRSRCIGRSAGGAGRPPFDTARAVS